MRVYDLLHTDDIYAGLDVSGGLDVQGWWDYSEKFMQLAMGAQFIVEIGSWLGKSAIEFCKAAPQAEVVCIDTWLGAAEMWHNKLDPDRYLRLRKKHGYPQLYYDFLRNIVLSGKQSQVTPMPLPSSIALKFLKDSGIYPDLIYIDGSHEEKDVIDDIQGSLQLKPKIICGDDYQGWPSVRRAVDHGCKDVQLDGRFWWVVNS